MKIGFYLENEKIPNIDLSNPEKGNPGCGGTEFLFSALPHYLTKLVGSSCQTIVFANHIDRLPANVETFKVSTVIEAAKRAKIEGCDIYVYRPRRNIANNLLDLISDLKLPTIAWAHVTPTGYHIRQMAKAEYLKALVCVEHEQYDLLQDSPSHKKLTYIVNGFDIDGFKLLSPPGKDPNLVIYLGALVPQKGFHLLAKVWPQIVKQIPEARLVVIGSKRLYDNDAKVGRWGIADSTYEEKYIIPYLSDDNGQPHASVEFAGMLGLEKKELLYRAAIGVPNPTGQSENCPGSALEIQACGTAVVSGAYYGLLDTAIHGMTGLLGRSEGDLIANICTLLKNPLAAVKMGEEGKKFVREKYNYEKVVHAWMDLFTRILKDERPWRHPFKRNITRHSKWLIILNRYLQIVIGGLVEWPSVLEIKNCLSNRKARKT